MLARPQTVTVAAFLQVLLSLANLASPLFPLEGVPEFIVYLGVALGIAGLLASAGLWMLRKWSIWLTIIVSGRDLLSAGPGDGFCTSHRPASRRSSNGCSLCPHYCAGSASDFAACFRGFLLSFREALTTHQHVIGGAAASREHLLTVR